MLPSRMSVPMILADSGAGKTRIEMAGPVCWPCQGSALLNRYRYARIGEPLTGGGEMYIARFTAGGQHH